MANTASAANFLVNIVELQNTITSAGGTSAVGTLSNSVAQLQQMVNFDQKQIKADVISKFSVSPITVTDSLNLSNATLFVNGQAASVGPGGNQSTISYGPTQVLLYNTSTIGQTAYELKVGAPSVTPYQVTADGSTRFPAAGTPTIGYYLTCMDTAGTAEWQPVVIPSDARLKENIRPFGTAAAAATVSSLRGVRFRWAASKAEDIGVIAQEVREHLPEIVFPGGREGNHLVVQYQSLIPVLLESIKDLQARVDELERQQWRLNREPPS